MIAFRRADLPVHARCVSNLAKLKIDLGSFRTRVAITGARGFIG